MYLVDPESEEPVTALSGHARKQWLPRASSVRTVRVLAPVEWRQEDSGPEYREKCKVDGWYVPWIEVCWSAKGQV